MKQLLIIVATLFFNHSYAQVEVKRIFHKATYINGSIYNELDDTIKINNEKIDIYFFKDHFYSPYNLPYKFVDKKHKNRIISVWAYKKTRKNFAINYENTYKYDNLGRVINYTYSGCLVCSNLPYSYNVTYNSIGQVESIKEATNGGYSYKFYYDQNDNITKFEHFLFSNLLTKIILQN